jgi:hypothetical protein
LELAVSTLSEHLGGIVEDMDKNSSALSTVPEDRLIELERRCDAVESQLKQLASQDTKKVNDIAMQKQELLTLLEEKLQTKLESHESHESQLQNSCAHELSLLRDRVQSLEANTENLVSMAAQTVVGIVAAGGAPVTPSTHGDLSTDLRNSDSVRLSAGTRVRLVFPQERLEGGAIYMGAVWVDSSSMQISTGWLLLNEAGATTVDGFTI